MIYYEITMQHSRESFELLSQMQYNLFCKTNRIVRSVLTIAAVLFGLMHTSEWWGILIIAYGCYLGTSTYSSANHTAHKLSDQVEKSGLGYPKSRFRFEEKELIISPIPDQRDKRTSLSYPELQGLGEDLNYFYLFRDSFGGYMIPKEALGNKTDRFRDFLEEHTGLRVQSRTAPIIRLLRYLCRTKDQGKAV